LERRKNNFDAIRLLAAIAVIFDHSHAITGHVGFAILGTSIGEIAVKVFFVISGYLIYTSWQVDPSFHRYLIRRALRIFPALIVLCLVTVLIVGPLLTTMAPGRYFSQCETYGYFKNILLYPQYFLPGVFQNNIYPRAVNGSLWTLPIEFAMYLLLPMVSLLVSAARTRWAMPALTIAFCALSIYWVRISPPDHDPSFYGTLLLPTLGIAPYFFLGASIRHMKWERFLDPVVAIFAIACVAFFRPHGATLEEVVLYLLLPYVVLATACRPSPWLENAGKYGDMSYGVYIYAFLVQQCVARLSSNSLSATQNALITLPVVLVLAWLSWHLVEKRALALKPSRKRSMVIQRTVAG